MNLRTTSDAERILYQKIKNSALDTACNGVLCKWNRPDDKEKKEDIVINSVATTTNSTQRMVANVNIYTSDVKSPEVENHWQPNTKRIKDLTDMALALFGEVHETYEGTNVHYFVANQQTFTEPDIKQTYINLRVEFIFYPV